MSENEYRRHLVKGFMAHVENGGLHIEGANYLPEVVDYADNDYVKILATSAVHTADGFCDLVKRNCDTSNPDISRKAHLEMYLSLAGLACEIYMKAIIYHEFVHGGKQVRGHKLNELFERLPIAVQAKIKTKINNIENSLITICDMFTTLRYDFEFNRIDGEYLVAFVLMDELKEIAHKYPKKEPGAIKYANGVLAFE